ncbi:DUF4189 domain-containing protein [Lysobacter enzymogenes]|uniref:DUF4189 domain-containing protein n=1 Tax=Lysobacter enzymogenes TaxID=69 RepID=A0A3N2REZ7_LYSEN|nr:DUF4189 domain-containing protein [Lysobacter enzymogenes]ROU05946.1 DUF4189 domain-containing protein [Lysobacter enzymogenes]
MKNFVGLLVLISAFALPGLAVAEDGCPSGFIPNAAGTPNAQCIPAGGLGYSGSSESAVKWERRWGAFTLDQPTGKIGVATAMSSKRKAEKEALRDCQARGGSSCRVMLAFTNQCGAIASGKDANGGFEISAAGGVNAAVAKSSALERCGQKAGACEIFLSECSYAEQVQ